MKAKLIEAAEVYRKDKEVSTTIAEGVASSWVLRGESAGGRKAGRGRE